MANPETHPCVVLFPGTGVPLCGHEMAFYERNRTLMEPFLASASRFAGVDMAGSFEPNIDLSDQRISQVFTYAFSCGMYRVLQNSGIKPSMAAGYSMGIYGALFASEAISFEDGLCMIDTAYSLMKSEAERAGYGMGVIIGLTRSEVESLAINR